MIKITEVEQIQALLYDLMAEFHNICEENHLYYVVFGGTLLGAVRHKAMIPWDDDVDVCMPRKDYEKFCDIVSRKYSESYTISSYPKKNYVYEFAKFGLKRSLLIEKNLRPRFSKQNLYIDVFPIDGYPAADDEKTFFRKLRRFRTGVYRSTWKITWQGKFVLRRSIYLLYRIIGYKYFLTKLINESKKNDFDSSQYVSMEGAGWYEKGKLKKEIYMKRKLYKFGNMEVWGIEDYDEHLTKLYGDYMTPPPKEKRNSHHAFDLYLEENNG